MFSVLHRECINLQKGHLDDKMRLNSILKGCFFFVKRFCSIIRVASNSQEKFTVLQFSHIGFLSLLLRMRRDFVIREFEVGWKSEDEYI